MNVRIASVFVVLIKILVTFSYSDGRGWTSLLEENRNHDQTSNRDRPWESHHNDGYYDDNDDMWTSLSQHHRDQENVEFSKYFDEKDTVYHKHGDNYHRKNDDDLEGKQFGLGFGLTPLLNPGYYHPGSVFSLPGLHRKPPVRSSTTTKTTAKTTVTVTRAQSRPTRPRRTTTRRPVRTTTTRRTPIRTTTRRTPIRTTTRPRRLTSRPTRHPHSLEDEDALLNNNFLDHFNDFDDDSGFDLDYDPDPNNIATNSPSVDLQLTSLTPADLEGRVRSLQEIFSSLHISSPGCQRRLVCHLAKDMEEFTPLSHLVLDHLDIDTTQVGDHSKVEVEDTVEYLDLLQAVEAGRHRTCYKYSDVCQYKGEDMINADGLRAWKLMYKVLTMKALAVRSGQKF